MATDGNKYLASLPNLASCLCCLTTWWILFLWWTRFEGMAKVDLVHLGVLGEPCNEGLLGYKSFRSGVPDCSGGPNVIKNLWAISP